MANTQINPLEWTSEQTDVLNMKFAGRLSAAKMAERVGVSARTIERWLAHPDFKARLEAMRADFAASVQHVTFADKARRIHALNDAATIALNELEARPLLKEVRPTKDGFITNEAFNNAAMSEFRAALADIAAEKGERKNVTEVTGKDGGPIEVSSVKQQLAAKLADRAKRTGTSGAASDTDRR